MNYRTPEAAAGARTTLPQVSKQAAPALLVCGLRNATADGETNFSVMGRLM